MPRGEKVGADALRNYSARTSSIVEADECRSDVLSAGLSILLADLDTRNPTTDADGWMAALVRADHYVSHVLGCRPTDGDAWVRLAMVRQALGTDDDELANLMERSAWYAPAEHDTVLARFEVWRKADETTLVQASSVFDHDLLTVMNYFSPRDAMSVLSGGDSVFMRRLVAAAAALSDERYQALRKAGLAVLPARSGSSPADRKDRLKPMAELPPVPQTGAAP